MRSTVGGFGEAEPAHHADPAADALLRLAHHLTAAQVPARMDGLTLTFQQACGDGPADEPQEAVLTCQPRPADSDTLWLWRLLPETRLPQPLVEVGRPRFTGQAWEWISDVWGLPL